MTLALEHLLVVPIALPMITGAGMLFIGDRRRQLRTWLNLASSAAFVAVCVTLFVLVAQGWGGRTSIEALDIGPTPMREAAVGVYLAGNWPVPIGIALAIDRLSALMLVLTAVLGLASAIYATARWDRAGAHYHSLFQFQLMGLAGAFLTADLFNLFVFFEVLLAASYGLVLHGTGEARVSAGLHYIVVNLAAASLFLLGISLIYATTGTLTLADIALRVTTVAPADRGLLETGVALIGVVFLIKAGAWPMNFWLPPAYGSASAPVAALFSIMTKVGLYAVIRISSLLLGEDATSTTAGFGNEWLLVIGVVTVMFGVIGVFNSHGLAKLGCHFVIVSSGTLMAALALDQPRVTSGALFYLVNSTLAIGAFFLLVEMVERSRVPEGVHPADHYQHHELDHGDDPSVADVEIVGVPISSATAFLGLSFIGSGLLLIGLPPLSGFLAKFSLLSAVLSDESIAAGRDALLPGNGAWWLFALVILSGLAGTIAFTRAGIRLFWAVSSRKAPVLRANEALPVMLLLGCCLAITIFADPLQRFLQTTAETLAAPSAYVQSVMQARPMP